MMMVTLMNKIITAYVWLEFCRLHSNFTQSYIVVVPVII